MWIFWWRNVGVGRRCGPIRLKMPTISLERRQRTRRSTFRISVSSCLKFKFSSSRGSRSTTWVTNQKIIWLYLETVERRCFRKKLDFLPQIETQAKPSRDFFCRSRCLNTCSKFLCFVFFVNYFKVWSLNALRSNKIQRSVASERPTDQLNCCCRDEIDRSLRRGGRDTKTGQRCRWPPTSRRRRRRFKTELFPLRVEN